MDRHRARASQLLIHLAPLTSVVLAACQRDNASKPAQAIEPAATTSSNVLVESPPITPPPPSSTTSSTAPSPPAEKPAEKTVPFPNPPQHIEVACEDKKGMLMICTTQNDARPAEHYAPPFERCRVAENFDVKASKKSVAAKKDPCCYVAECHHIGGKGRAFRDASDVIIMASIRTTGPTLNRVFPHRKSDPHRADTSPRRTSARRPAGSDPKRRCT